MKETGVERDVAERLVQIAHRARALKGHGLDEGISTRLLVYTGKLIAEGVAAREACRMAMTTPITDDADIRDTIEHAVDMAFA
jgi:nitric oxide reductase NorQ protein